MRPRVARAARLASTLRSSGLNGISRISQDSYDTHAAAYARHLDPTLMGSVERLVELAGARPGVRLLDLASGTGAVARAAARRGASVVGVDVSPGMLGVARGLSPHLDFRLADAGALPFDGGAFDAVTCGLSVSHFTELDKALAEVLRVLRAGGRLIASTWARGSSNPTRAVGELLDRYTAPVETLDEETWMSAERGSELLRQAGFAKASVQTELFGGAFADIDDALAWALGWPLRAARLARLDPGRRERFVADARRALANADLAWSFAFNFYVAHRPDSPPRP